MKISTIILTKNEALNIDRSLSSVLPLSDEIIVVDSFSDDSTVEIAQNYTDKVFQNAWPGYSEQRKYAISKTTNDWILWIDADEEISPELADTIRQLDYSIAGYQIPILVKYLGKWIRHCGWYPGYKLRLFNKTKGEFNDVMVHETFSVSGDTLKLKDPIFHYPYKNISHHLQKIDTYTSLAAEQMQAKGKKPSVLSALTHSISRFFKMYFLKVGFLSGKQGLVISVLGSYYVFLKYIKLWEQKNTSNKS